MTEETVEQKPFITINDVQISVEDLPEEARGVFGRLQRLNQKKANTCLLYTSPSPRDGLQSRMPSSA